MLKVSENNLNCVFMWRWKQSSLRMDEGWASTSDWLTVAGIIQEKNMAEALIINGQLITWKNTATILAVYSLVFLAGLAMRIVLG